MSAGNSVVSIDMRLAAPKWLEPVMPILSAILAHLYLAWIHPFGDGNGRSARLLEFGVLLTGRVPTVAAHLLANFYNDTRSEYYRQLRIASESGGDVVPKDYSGILLAINPDNSSRSTGLTKWWSNPASSARHRSLFCPHPVTAISWIFAAQGSRRRF